MGEPWGTGGFGGGGVEGKGGLNRKKNNMKKKSINLEKRKNLMFFSSLFISGITN